MSEIKELENKARKVLQLVEEMKVENTKLKVQLNDAEQLLELQMDCLQRNIDLQSQLDTANKRIEDLEFELASRGPRAKAVPDDSSKI